MRGYELERFLGLPTYVDPTTDVGVWHLAPGIAVTELGATPCVTLAVARFITDRLHLETVGRSVRGQGLTVVHDWHALQDFDFDARTHLIRWCLAHRTAFARTGLICPPMNAIMRLALHVAEAALGSERFPFETFMSTEAAVRAFRLRPTGSYNTPLAAS